MIRITLYLTTGKAETRYVGNQEKLSEVIKTLKNPDGLLTFEVSTEPDREPVNVIFAVRHIVKIVHTIEKTS